MTYQPFNRLSLVVTAIEDVELHQISVKQVVEEVWRRVATGLADEVMKKLQPAIAKAVAEMIEEANHDTARAYPHKSKA